MDSYFFLSDLSPRLSRFVASPLACLTEKKQRRHFLLEEQMKFCSGSEKLRNASGHQRENERQ